MINENILSILVEQNAQKKLITGEYLTDENNENFKYIKDKFFFGEEVEKVKVLNTGSGLFTSIAEIIANYTGEPISDIYFPTNKLIKDYLVLGFATVGIERIDGQLQTVYLPAENYYHEDGVDRIIRAYQKPVDTLRFEYYYLITSYTGGTIENKLYETSVINNGVSLLQGKEVPLDTLKETKDLLPLIDTGLEKCMWVIKDDELEQYPISEIQKIKNIVYSIDRKIVMFDTQFLKNLESFVLLKGINLPNRLIEKYHEGKINFADIGRYITTDQDGKIEFVENTNQLLNQAKDYEIEQIKKISSITSVPLDFLGGTGTAGAIGEGSRQLLHGAFIKKIQNIRALFDRYIVEIFEVIEPNTQYSWQDIFAKNSRELIDELQIALQNKLISQRSAIKAYRDLNDEEIDMELLLIQQDADTNRQASEQQPVEAGI